MLDYKKLLLEALNFNEARVQTSERIKPGVKKIPKPTPNNPLGIIPKPTPNNPLGIIPKPRPLPDNFDPFAPRPTPGVIDALDRRPRQKATGPLQMPYRRSEDEKPTGARQMPYRIPGNQKPIDTPKNKIDRLGIRPSFRLPEPPPPNLGSSRFGPDPDEEAAWGEYKKRKGIKERQLGPDAKFGDAGPMPGRERFQFQQEYLKTLTPEKRKAYDERQSARLKEIGDAFTSFSSSSKMSRS